MEIILDYGGFLAFQLIQNLSKTCSAATTAWLVPAMLRSPIDVDKVCTLLHYEVQENRFARLLSSASDDFQLMNVDTYKKVIVLQLALTSLRTSRTHPYVVTDAEICGLILQSISHRLIPEHAVFLRVLNFLRLQNIIEDVCLGDRIQHICFAWRQSCYDDLSVINFLAVVRSFAATLRHLGFTF